MIRQAEAMWQAGEKEEAMSFLQTESRKNPMDSSLIVRLAQLQEEAGLTDQALKNYVKVAEQESPASDWGRISSSRVAAISQVQLAGFLQLASKYDGLVGGGLGDGLGWLQRGQAARARKMFREKYEADRSAQADLWAWYLASANESRSGSIAAQYDLSVSQKTVSEEIRSYENAQQALPAVITLLTFIQQDVEVPAAVEALWQIKKALGTTEFPDEVGNMAIIAFGNSTDSKAQKISQWLNNRSD